MSVYTLPNMSSGIDTALVETVQAVPQFTSMLLLFVFMVVAIGGSLAQKRRNGVTDMPMWVTLGALSTLLVSLPLTIVAGLIQLEVLVIVVVITIFSGIWLFLDRNRNEI